MRFDDDVLPEIDVTDRPVEPSDPGLVETVQALIGKWQEGYLSKCDLCLDLRRHLVSKQDFAELSPKEFYVHLV